MNHATVEGLPSFTADGPSFIPEAAAKPVEEASAEAVVEDMAAVDPGADLIQAGEKVFKKCKACHEVGDGAKNKSGPQLNDIVGRSIGSADGFNYSKVFKAALDEGRVWDEASQIGRASCRERV